MKGKHLFLIFFVYYEIAVIKALHPSSFRKTKAEDDGSIQTNSIKLFTSCDLTSQLCDINCCDDHDCTEVEKESFSCLEHREIHSNHYYYFNCENVGAIDSAENPLLCLQYENSPYLGDFFIEGEMFSGHSFLNILVSRNKGISSFRIKDVPSSNEGYYKRGSNTYFLDPNGGYEYLYIRSNILNKGNGYCSKRPLRYLVDESSNCFYLMNEDECLLNQELHLQYQFNILSKIELLCGFNNVNVTYDTVCLGSAAAYFSINGDKLNTIVKDKPVINDDIHCNVDTMTKVNEDQSLCENVVVGMNYTINVDGALIKTISVTILTANIPLDTKPFLFFTDDQNTPNEAAVYVLQKVNVLFKESGKGMYVRNGYATGQHVFLNR